MRHKDLFKLSLIYSVPLIWNNLPENLRQVETIDNFDKKCIKWMKGIQPTVYQSISYLTLITQYSNVCVCVCVCVRACACVC